MRLRTRSLLLLVIPLLLLMGVLVILGRTVVLRTAESVEQNDLRRTVQSVRRTVDEEIEGLGGSVRDWAVWDDTYLFASGKNPSYAETQLTADTFATLRLNLVAILDQEGSVLLSLLCEEDTIEPAELDGALRDSILHQTGATSGMAVVEGRPLLVAAHPIRTSADLGPTLGRLVFGRWLSPARVQEIGATIGADVLFATRGDPIVPAALSARLVAAEDAVVARRLGEERIAGYALYPAPLSTSSLVMRVEMPREAWGVARKSLAASRLGLLALALLTIAAVLFGLERFVLSRVAKLSREVRGIGSTGGFAGRVTEGGGTRSASSRTPRTPCSPPWNPPTGSSRRRSPR